MYIFDRDEIVFAFDRSYCTDDLKPVAMSMLRIMQQVPFLEMEPREWQLLSFDGRVLTTLRDQNADYGREEAKLMQTHGYGF